MLQFLKTVYIHMVLNTSQILAPVFRNFDLFAIHGSFYYKIQNNYTEILKLWVNNLEKVHLMKTFAYDLWYIER